MHGTRQCTAIQISRYNSLRNSSAHFQYCNWSHRYQISLATALQAPPFSAKHLRCGLEMAPVLRKLPRLGGEFQFSVCLSLWRVASIPDSLCTSIQLGWPAHVSTSPELETRNPRNPSPETRNARISDRLGKVPTGGSRCQSRCASPHLSRFWAPLQGSVRVFEVY